jgi:hypothetical protein
MRATWTGTSPTASSGGNTSSPINASPFSSTQFSENADCTCVHGRPAQPHRYVAVVLLVLRLAEPIVGHAVAADVCGPAVDDEDLPMVAVVEAAEAAQPQRPAVLDRHAGVPHPAEAGTPEVAAAVGVEHDPHRHALASACGQGRGHPFGDLAFLGEEGLEVHRVARGGDVGEQAVEERAICDQLDVVAGAEAALRHAGDGALEPRDARLHGEPQRVSTPPFE